MSQATHYSALLKELLDITLREQASDLHLSVDHYPILRVAGRLIALVKLEKLAKEDTEGLAYEMMDEGQEQRFKEDMEMDLSYTHGEKVRFRVNVFRQQGNVSIAMRLIPTVIPTIKDLSLPPILHEFIQRPQGFILVTGPSGQGKSTTLASMIDEINHTRADHVLTIEDPVEYLFEDDRSVIDQREVYRDTKSFMQALKSTFRQDPDVIMVGEMRDPETISTAITAAETGHLVLATLHTNSAAQTIHRVVDSFPAAQQGQIRAQLSGSLIGVISQRLVPRLRGGLVPACEIMINTPAVANLIRESKIHEIPLVIETSAEIGMISLNRYLAGLVRAREIDLEVAMSYSLNPAELRSLVR